MLVVQSVGSFTVSSMGRVIWVVYDLPEINGVESVTLQSLAGDISDRDEDAVSVR